MNEQNKIEKIKKQFMEDVCKLPNPICQNRPPDITNLMNACLSCKLRETCRLLFVDK